MTATLERRKEVLQLAREHDFIILEGKPRDNYDLLTALIK